MYQKGDTGAKLLFYLLNLLGFFMFSLHLRNSSISLYSLISLCFLSHGARGEGGGWVVLFNYFAKPPRLF